MIVAIPDNPGVDYSQMDDVLYTIDDHGQSINAYHADHARHEILTIIPRTVGTDASITYSNSLGPRLYISGGDSLNALQIYDIESEKWIENIPPMLNQRRNHGSIVLNGTLYIISGEGEDSIEAIDIMDIQSM